MTSPSVASRKLPLPSSGDSASGVVLDGHRAFVVVGANGTGKTRLGSWLELSSPIQATAHRISAQKSLTMPASVSPRAPAEAEAALRWGLESGSASHREGFRWQSNPSTALLNDFDKLLVYLFSDEYEKSIAFRQAHRADPTARSPETKLDTVARLWKKVMPHRELVIGGGTVQTRQSAKSATYNASAMSDGERVVFYLIGECLAVPNDGWLIVDEPELHLHKSIQAELWDALEAERSDLAFVYLTHDLDFATSRAGAPKVCLKAYDGINWEWYVAPDDSEIPEDVFLQIIGSRKPVLFVEGDETSLDYFFLRHAYEDASVMPAGSCEHVIHATATFETFKPLHGLSCRGLIDRDHREASDIAYLEKKGIFVLPVAAIENILLGEDVLRQVAATLLRDDADVLVRKVKDIIVAELSTNL